ncbi:MAG: hypothetical protein J1E34_05115 [Oscillospiraceae bacterium]|nr:hypothetical protein [Oscillospiraceae bacterium]
MKKHKFIFILSVISLLICLCACGNADSGTQTPMELSASDFTDSARSRDENYSAALKTKSVLLNGISIHIAENLFDEEISPRLAQKIFEDHTALYDLGKEAAGNAEVYVLSRTVTDKIVAAGTELFCTLEDVESGEYLPYLTAVVFDSPSWWQCVGVSRIVLGCEVDDDLGVRLRAHLEQGEDDYILSLFPGYFLADFAGEDTRELVSQSAQALTEYILSKTDFSAFLSEGDKVNYRTDWLDSIGLPADIDYLWGDAAGYVGRLNFMESKDFPLILTGETFTHYLQETNWLVSADNAYQFMLDFYGGLAQLYTRLESDAPEFYSEMRQDENKHFHIKLYSSDYSTSSRTASDATAVVLDWGDALHEAVHLLIPTSITGDVATWLNEGLAEYLSVPYLSYWSDSRDYVSRRVDSFATDVNVSRMTELQLQLKADVEEAFEKLNSRNISQVYEMEQTAYLVYRAVGWALLQNPGKYASIPQFASVADHIGFKSSYPGNRLSYGEAMVFVDYLAQQYGLDAIIKADMDMQSYRELFLNEAAFNEEFDRFIERSINYVTGN